MLSMKTNYVEPLLYITSVADGKQKKKKRYSIRRFWRPTYLLFIYYIGYLAHQQGQCHARFVILSIQDWFSVYAWRACNIHSTEL